MYVRKRRVIGPLMTARINTTTGMIHEFSPANIFAIDTSADIKRSH
jgi:hypothetical protein